MKATKLYAAADRAINQALRLRKGEKYLLVTDVQKLEIAEALAFYAKQAGAETTTYLMTETLRPITGPTRQFKELIRGASVTTYLLEGRFAEKPFRGFMVAEGGQARPHLHDAGHHPRHDGAAGGHRLLRDGPLHEKGHEGREGRG